MGTTTTTTTDAPGSASGGVTSGPSPEDCACDPDRSGGTTPGTCWAWPGHPGYCMIKESFKSDQCKQWCTPQRRDAHLAGKPWAQWGGTECSHYWRLCNSDLLLLEDAEAMRARITVYDATWVASPWGECEEDDAGECHVRRDVRCENAYGEKVSFEEEGKGCCATCIPPTTKSCACGTPQGCADDDASTFLKLSDSNPQPLSCTELKNMGGCTNDDHGNSIRAQCPFSCNECDA